MAGPLPSLHSIPRLLLDMRQGVRECAPWNESSVLSPGMKHLGQNPGKLDPVDRLIPGLGQGTSDALGRSTEGSVKLRQNKRNFFPRKCLPAFPGSKQV